MIKKLFFTALLLIFSSNVISQSNPEQQAGEVTKEMVKVLSLDDVLTEKVYKIQLSRFNQVNFIRQEYKNNPEIVRAELRKLENNLFGSLHSVLGKALMNQWKEYKLSK
tara:strand:- start:386 stop:712 length:327 start_codon:yes stop_codon:yes gene_type:complete